MMKNTICIKKPLVSQSILTSLKIKKYLLIGVGTSLQIFDLKDKKRQLSVNVFIAATIHGIKEWPEKEINKITFMIYGQKSITVIRIYEDTLSYKTILPEQQLEDWILSGTVGNDESMLILTAHNKCLKLKLLPLSNKIDEQIAMKNCKYDVLTAVLGECCENSLLYSGLICRTSCDHFVLMGGTAFGNIVVWSLCSSSIENERRSPLHILSSPSGTIFSVSYNNELMLIAATSDDRSVRLWKVTCKKIYIDQQSLWENSEISQIFCSYGHSARVWRANILSDQTVLSCGEDSQVCHWSNNGRLLSSWKAHPGTSIWCVTSADNIVYTGGGDGSLKMWSLHNKAVISRIEFPLNNANMLKSKIDLKLLPKVNNFARAINLIDSTSAVIVNNSGHLWMWKNSAKEWTLLYENFALQGYIMTSMNKSSSLIALGTLSGFVIIFNIDSQKFVCETRVSSAKIQSLIFIDEVLLTSSCGIIKLWTLENYDVNGYLQLVQEHELPFFLQHWVTAFTFCEVSLSKGEDSFVAGDRSGNVHLYLSRMKEPVCTLKSLHNSHGVSSVNKSKNFIITSGRDGYIRFLNVDKDELVIVYDIKIQFGSWICGIVQWKHYLIAPIFNGAKLQFWNLSQDQLICDLDCGGGHRSWDILLNDKRFQSSGRLQDFSNNESSSLLAYSYLKDGIPSIYTLSFEQRLISEILIPISGREILSLISLWTHNEKCIITFGGEDTLLYVHFIKKNKIHKINTIKSHLSSIRTIVKIDDYSFMFVQNSGKYHNCKEIFLLSCGGRAQMKVWKYSLTALGDESVYHDTLCDKMNNEIPISNNELEPSLINKAVSKDEIISSDFNDGYFSNLLDPMMLCQKVGSHMLKDEKQNHWKCPGLTFDPETRYMDSIAVWISANIALFILASSDGFLRIFKYGIGKEFELVHSEDCSFCLLRLSLVKLQQNLFLITSTTRGNLIFWDIQKFAQCLINDKLFKADDTIYKQISLFQLTSSGINSLSVQPTDNLFEKEKESNGCETIYLAAGCDSGEIFIVQINVMSLKVDNQFSIVSACGKILSKSINHAAQVSGLAWLSSDLLCSISTDQRLIVWQLQMAMTSIKLTPIEVAFSSVPDIQGLHLIPTSEDDDINSRRIYVYGSGLQIFYVDIGVKS